MIFDSRNSAGLELSKKLRLENGERVIMLGLARGGVVVAAAIARKLNIPFDVLVIKKISAPGQSELAIGALAPDGVSFIDWKFAGRMGAEGDYIRSTITELGAVIKQTSALYRKGRKPLDIREKIVLLVDDGVATGATIEVAIKWARKKHAKKIIVAVPVVPLSAVGKIQPEADEFVILETPSEFSAVGEFYKDFPQVGDEQVIELLRT